ncbi:MAG: hypothetical protein GY874_18480 [Desulfobacteraceae bacterium]|nr:hypothetical protein [Desulfobacteraceae bacterium]
MAKKSGKQQIAQLNEKMYKLIASFPRTRGELVDFHFKSEFENYLSAIQDTTGQPLLVIATNADQMRASIRRLILLSDMLLFNTQSYAGSGKISFFPIPDKTKSPVLKIMPVLDPVSKKYRSPKPVEVGSLLSLLGSRSLQTGRPEGILGIEWTPGTSGWQQSHFTRTSEPYKNEKGQKCHIASGLTHIEIPTEDTLLEETKTFLRKGQVVFAPFIRTTRDASFIDEGVLKAGLFSGVLTVQDSAIHNQTGILHPLTDLEIPYLEQVPLSLLAKVLEDEGESLVSFRKFINRALVDIENLSEPAEAQHIITRLKRDLLEDELDRVRQILDRVSRMKAMTRIGVYVGTAALSIAGLKGLSLPGIVIGAGTIATVTLSELYKNYEEKRKVRHSPMHFVWRIESKIG